MNKVSIIVYEESSKFLDYLVYNNIFYKDLRKYDNVYYLIVSYESFIKISKRYKTKIIKYFGRKWFINFISYHKYMIISFFICMFILKLLTMTIFDIKIYSDDDNIKNIIMTSLNENGISINKKKKSFDEISSIKENILSSNKETLEWIEIKERGCIYEVYVTPRVIDNKEEKSNEVSSIYSSSNGVVKSIVVTSGTKMVDNGDYVKKGDLLISGNIFKNDEIVDSKEALGSIFAEVWYIAYVNVPFDFVETINTGKIINHYYLDIFNHKFTLIGKYDSSDTINKTKLILDKPYLPFKLYKEEKTIYKYNKKHLSENEALMIGVDEATYKVGYNLKEGEHIISKKVLKKEVKSSKMYIEVFFKVYKNIGVTSNIDKGKIEYGSIN